MMESRMEHYVGLDGVIKEALMPAGGSSCGAIRYVNQHSGPLEQRHAGFLKKSNGQKHGLPVPVE